MSIFNKFIFPLAIPIIAGKGLTAQSNYSRLSFDTQMRDTFSFANKWSYSWEIYKDDSTGEFIRNSSEPLLPSDTAHLYYTANCFTNLQGGYPIRYCFAKKNKGVIALPFSDGLPAYASEFYFYIIGDSFYFKPKTIYAVRTPGQRISYKVTKQKLILNNSKYKTGDTISGYVDAEFIETVSVPKKSTGHTFYLKGYIHTPLK